LLRPALSHSRSECNLLPARGVPLNVTVAIARPEQELLESIAERRPEAFDVLISREQDRLYSLAWRVTGNRQDAEEVAQDAFIRAHRALFREYEPSRIRELALRPWLTTIVLNLARNRLRSRRPTRSLDAVSPDGRPLLEPVDGRPGPLATAEQHELGAVLERAVLDLPWRQRAAVVLRLVEGLSYQETAVALGRPLGTVKSDVHRGLRLLRQRLGPLLEANERR
jgi:RNA polymerase sigma-70 factor, ECF subfamily